MIIEKLLNDKDLTESEKHIAHYILDKSNDINILTSTQLGKLSYSSQSSVIRLYKKLGFLTYREFISTLTIERNEFFKTQDVLMDHPSQLFSSYEDIQKTISKLYAETMINTNILLDKNQIIRVCNRIMSATTIDIYGIGISDTIAKQMAFKLQSLGLHCSYQNGLNTHYINQIKKNTNISILISLTGHNELIISIAKFLHEHQVHTVSIIGQKETELIDLCQDNLIFFNNEYTDIDVMCATFAAEYVINLIYALIMARNQILKVNSIINNE